MSDRKKVLIGDDTVDFGITTASALRSYDLYAITRRKDGNILLNAIREEKPDVVVIDAVMPHMDAYSSSIVMTFKLLSSLKMLSWENLEMPVMNTKRSHSSQSFSGE